MGKSAAQKQQVSEYSMSIHSGVCQGADAITGLYVGEKLAWEGEVTTGGLIAVNAPSLFGGSKDGGRVGGIMVWLPGTDTQIMPNELAARQGLTSATSPAYRGIASVYFIGYDGVPTGGVDTGGTGAVPPGTTVGGGGTVGGDGSGGTGGGGSGCPVAWAPVLLADTDRNGPGETCPAGSLRPDVDWVWTRHEHTGEWGAHPVTRKRLFETDLWQTDNDDVPPTSASHLWWSSGGWVRADALGEEAGETGVVVALTVADAHTYVIVDSGGEWHVSHNKVTDPIE